jgi:beta-glucanase (GH16 family)
MHRTCLSPAALALACAVLSGPAAAQTKTGWALVWADEFNQADGSSPDPSKWAFDTGAGGWGNGELEYYTARTNNARIENGQLVIEAMAEDFSGSSYTSARLKTQGKWSWTYGRIEARIKIPRTQGLWPAFWMLGTNIPAAGWPACGEIDIMENIGVEPALVHGTVHGPGYSGSGGISGAFQLPGGGAYADDYHVFAVEWTTNQIKWFVDSWQYFSVTPTRLPTGGTYVFYQPQFLLLNVAVGGQWPGYPDATTVLPQRMWVDYVRVYAPTNVSVGATNELKNGDFEANSLTNWTAYGAGYNTLIENINDVPVHNGSNVFKVFGQFTGGANDSGVYQDQPATTGQSFAASGWALTPSNDRLAEANSAWLEVTFRDAGSNILSLYHSAVLTSNSVSGAWLYLPVTNQLDPTTFAVTGSATDLAAPARTQFVRVQMLFRQPAGGSGSVLFDDISLRAGGANAVSTPVSGFLDNGSVTLAFASLLGLSYQVGSKTNLNDAAWVTLTNLTGDGTLQSIAVEPDSATRFFRVTQRCE